ncbi:cytosolic factor, phosphatidylinositol/phosphatidylcholine transfer protein [Physocladia obscura]|uniref:Cytosolic factor, phosphatidylinositol/phosphatidylcholine transfer protein n=1 Tax=Physocladia obscura TaxID=109957 RepID=A0AAD5T8K9_9FUNG|nr:cytosolic factor, phosphatidylinositol/phosphatidylcholine transfer protein [Physocladia obscura]
MSAPVSNDPVEVLAKFKTTLTQSSPGFESEVHNDGLLLRFLKARKFDVDKAKLMFDAYLAWRRDFKVDTEILHNLKYPEYNKVMEIYPRFYHKTDKVGRPVYFEILSNLSIKQFDGGITTPERFVQYYVREFEKTIEYRFRALSCKAGALIDKSCTILDIKNVPIMQFPSIRKFLGQITHIAQNYYPETLGRMFIINSPVVFQGIWAVIKGMLDENTVAKISILGTSYQRELLETIDAENLPVEYGGKCNCAMGCRHSDVGPWNDGTVKGYPIPFWENINIVKEDTP